MNGAVGGLDVLMVEDDVHLAQMYRIKLEAEGHVVRTAVDGPAGLRQALDRLPQCLLLDIRLPGFDGLELLARLRGDPRGGGVPVIILTNYGDPEMIRRGAQLGARAHLIKSQTTPARLTDAVRDTVSAGLGGDPTRG